MKTALVCVACQEQNYIKEWLDWHFRLGFTDAYVFENNWRCCLGKEVREAYEKEGHKVWLIPFDGGIMQLKAYNHFLKHCSDPYDWAAFIDVDEFLFLKKVPTIDMFLSEYKTFGGLGINWKIFGSSGHDEIKDGDYSVLKRFTHSQKGVNQHIKTFLNISWLKITDSLKYVSFINPHFVNLATYPRFTVDVTKSHYIAGPFNPEGNDDIAYIGHFITKSKSECRERRSRNRADMNSPREEGWEKFFNAHNLNDELNLDFVIGE